VAADKQHLQGVLVIGDVHGCYYTFKSMVKQYWRPEEELLIQLGDLINKGPHSAKCLIYGRKLLKKHPGRVYFLRGNHEQWFINHYRHDSENPTYLGLVSQFERAGLSIKEVVSWLTQLPPVWQDERLFISHAGLAKAAKDPYHLKEEKSLINNRSALQALRQVQVLGHNIMRDGKPFFSPKENAWYIDTGAWCFEYLSGLRFSADIHRPEVIRMETRLKDKRI
jgi:serine/threonine protein phosphatase 1